MVRNSGSHFDQAFNQPIHGPFHFFAPNRELANHMQEVVRQNPHLQPGLVGLETVAASLVSAQSIVALFYPIFDLGPAVIDLEHFTCLLDDCGEASGEAPDW